MKQNNKNNKTILAIAFNAVMVGAVVMSFNVGAEVKDITNGGIAIKYSDNHGVFLDGVTVSEDAKACLSKCNESALRMIAGMSKFEKGLFGYQGTVAVGSGEELGMWNGVLTRNTFNIIGILSQFFGGIFGGKAEGGVFAIENSTLKAVSGVTGEDLKGLKYDTTTLEITAENLPTGRTAKPEIAKFKINTPTVPGGGSAPATVTTEDVVKALKEGKVSYEDVKEVTSIKTAVEAAKTAAASGVSAAEKTELEGLKGQKSTWETEKRKLEDDVAKERMERDRLQSEKIGYELVKELSMIINGDISIDDVKVKAMMSKIDEGISDVKKFEGYLKGVDKVFEVKGDKVSFAGGTTVQAKIDAFKALEVKAEGDAKGKLKTEKMSALVAAAKALKTVIKPDVTTSVGAYDTSDPAAKKTIEDKISGIKNEVSAFEKAMIVYCGISSKLEGDVYGEIKDGSGLIFDSNSVTIINGIKKILSSDSSLGKQLEEAKKKIIDEEGKVRTLRGEKNSLETEKGKLSEICKKEIIKNIVYGELKTSMVNRAFGKYIDKMKSNYDIVFDANGKVASLTVKNIANGIGPDNKLGIAMNVIHGASKFVSNTPKLAAVDVGGGKLFGAVLDERFQVIKDEMSRKIDEMVLNRMNCSLIEGMLRIVDDISAGIKSVEYDKVNISEIEKIVKFHMRSKVAGMDDYETGKDFSVTEFVEHFTDLYCCKKGGWSIAELDAVKDDFDFTTNGSYVTARDVADIIKV